LNSNSFFEIKCNENLNLYGNKVLCSMPNAIRELVKFLMPLQISHPWDDNIKSTGIKDAWFAVHALKTSWNTLSIVVPYLYNDSFFSDEYQA